MGPRQKPREPCTWEHLSLPLSIISVRAPEAIVLSGRAIIPFRALAVSLRLGREDLNGATLAAMLPLSFKCPIVRSRRRRRRKKKGVSLLQSRNLQY